MKPRVHPADEEAIERAFRRRVNLSASELESWLETPESKSVGTIRRGERESVGRQSARRIIHILGKSSGGLTESDYVHMRKVAGYVARHCAQRPRGDITNTRWRWSLMNWGHDPLRSAEGGAVATGAPSLRWR